MHPYCERANYGENCAYYHRIFMVNPLSILFSIFLVIIIFHIYCHYTVLCADLLIKCSIMQNKAVMFFDSFEGSFFRR